MLSCFVVDNMWLFILGLAALWFAFQCYKESKQVPDKDQKYVYVTGCDTGFGNLLARHLDQLGYRVIAGCYTEKGEDELKKRASDRLTTVQLDVSDSANVARAAAFIRTLVGDKGELAFMSLLWVCNAVKYGIAQYQANRGSVPQILMFFLQNQLMYLHTLIPMLVSILSLF